MKCEFADMHDYRRFIKMSIGYFLTKIFHPNVSPKGEICVNVLKRDWKPDVGLKHVLQVLSSLSFN